MILRLTALILILAVSGGATTIVAVRSKNEIVVAADSKVTDTFGNATASVACKIVESGKSVFAYAGFARNARTGFSAPEIVAEALKNNASKPIVERAAGVAEALRKRLDKEIPGLRENDFVTYRTKIEGRIFLRILIAGFDGKRPVLIVRQFRWGAVADGTTGTIVSENDCADGCEGKYATRFLGETDAIDGLPEETPGFWKPGLVAGARKLVETEIAAREEYVGPPIDVVSIKKGSLKWIARKPQCAREGFGF